MPEQEKKKKILLTDDDSFFRSMMIKKLEKLGFSVSEASNGKEAIEIASKEMPDLVLLDVSMPIMDGVETLLKIKKDKKFKDLRVALLTGYGDPHHEINADEKTAKELGAVKYLKKTENLESMLESIKQLVVLKMT